MKYILWTADERLKFSTQLKQLRKESLKKIQAWTGFEPMNSDILFATAKLRTNCEDLSSILIFFLSYK